MKSLRVIIHGKVQGVNFRFATYEKALQFNLTGWVKNVAGRKVEALFEGEEEDLKEMLEFVKVGPQTARVTAVEEDYRDLPAQYSEFTIDY